MLAKIIVNQDLPTLEYYQFQFAKFLRHFRKQIRCACVLTLLFHIITLLFSAQGNTAFSSSDFEEALRLYTEALNALSAVGAPKNSVILLNRSATYIGLKRLE